MPSPGVSRLDLPKRARTLEDKARVREALITSGRLLFASKDFSDVSLRTIAKAAGYSPGVVYKHFRDRDSLFDAIRDAELERYLEDFQTVFSAHVDPEERLLAMAEFAILYSEKLALELGLRFMYSTSYRQEKNSAVAGRSPGVDRSPKSRKVFELHRLAVEEFLKTLPNPRTDSESGAFAMIAAISGVVALPEVVSSGRIASREEMGMDMIRALILFWKS